MKNSGTIEFIGVPSGDYESFVFDVDEETYKKITGKTVLNEDEEMLTLSPFKSNFYDKAYMLYPDDIISATLSVDNNITNKIKLKVRISIEVVEERKTENDLP